jgi:UDP-N-acetylglucosamine--N-acetylmuramyl-(pentapeptide) pyrophosphoryl-undecaprenol N-acetylglucosamine transferase
VSAHASSYRALIAAGGTGGHVYPALAVAAYLVELGWSVDWVGTEQGIEHRLVPASGLPLHCLTMSGFRGKGLIKKMMSLLRLALAVVESCSLIRRLKPDVVLGMGGYAAAPAGLAAFLTRRPLVIHEQNAVAGTTNRWLSPIAVRVLCGLPGPFAEARMAEVVGNPVRNVFRRADRQELQTLARFSGARPMRILVLGGSLGSAPLNELLPATTARLVSKGYGDTISVWHQCGERNRSTAELAWKKQPLGHLRLDAYIDDMAMAYGWADVVISRAGALTVSELAQTGTAAILIPLPHAIDDHQTANARVLEAQGAAVLLPQVEATPEAVSDLLERWMVSPAILSDMATALESAVQSDGTACVSAILMEVAHANA